MRSKRIVLATAIAMVLGIIGLLPVSCQRTSVNSDTLIPAGPAFFVRDQGSAAPDAPPGGVCFAIWEDGLFIITEEFPSIAGARRWGHLGSADAREVFDLLENTMTACRQYELATPSAQHYVIGRRADGLSESVLFPTFALSADSGMTESGCVRAIQLAMDRIAAMEGDVTPLPKQLDARVRYWVDGGRRAL